MKPSLENDDLVLGVRVPGFSTRLTASIRRRIFRRGVLVLVHPFGKNSVMHIKRIVAVEGDTCKGPQEERKIPPGYVFVMGDHSALTVASGTDIDSRLYGPLPMAKVIGLVIMRVNRGYRTLQP